MPDRFYPLRIGASFVNSFVYATIMNVSTGPSVVAHTIDTNSFALTRGMQLQAPAANAGNVYVGGESVSIVGSLQGLQLAATAGFFFPVDNINKIYVVADATSQQVTYLGF